MYSDIFCKVYNELGWNYYPEIFAQRLLRWLEREGIRVSSSLDMACGTGVLCRILGENGIRSAGVDLSEGMIAIARQTSPGIPFTVGDMTAYRPAEKYDLVTCTGDALNHLPELSQVEQVFGNVFACLEPGGHVVFDLLDPREISDSEPFEMDFDENTRVWFQMTQPACDRVELKIRVWENGRQKLEEVIRETVHDRLAVCRLLEKQGFRDIRCSHRLLEEDNEAATWFITAVRPEVTYE